MLLSFYRSSLWIFENTKCEMYFLGVFLMCLFILLFWSLDCVLTWKTASLVEVNFILRIWVLITVQMTETPGHRVYTCSWSGSAQSLSEIHYHVAIAASQQHNRACYFWVLQALTRYFCIHIILIFGDMLYHFLSAKSDHSVFFSFIRY